MRRFAPAHVLWTFREGSATHPSVRLATSVPDMKWPFLLNRISTPLVGNGEGYFRLKEAAAPLIGVQQFKPLSVALIKNEEMLHEAELTTIPDDEEIIVGFGIMQLPT